MMRAGLLRHSITDLRPLVSDLSFIEEAEQRRVDFSRVLLLDPVVRAREPEFGVRRVDVVGDAGGRLGKDCHVALAEDEERGDSHAFLPAYLAARPALQEAAEVRAVVVDGRRE